MSNEYNSHFFNQFYEEHGGGNYMDSEQWIPFFSRIALEIATRFQPKTVLEAGCACGYLVAALRDRGIESYGFDISDYAISHVREDIKDYCFVHSITEPIPKKYPQKYDLVITIEVLEHLFPQDGEKAIELLCGYSDMIIFSSTPSDIEDPTHVNVQLPEYWAKSFFRYQFCKQLNLDTTFISPWSVVFEKTNQLEQIIFYYELHLRLKTISTQIEKMSSPSITSKVYFDQGEGFGEANTINFNFPEKEFFEHTFQLPEGTSSIRVDPLEGRYCLLQQMDLYVDHERVDEFITNGKKNGNHLFFHNLDPQIILENLKEKSQVKISGRIYLLEENFLEFIMAYQGIEREKRIGLQQELLESLNRLDENTNLLEDKNQVLSSKEEEIHAKDTLLHEKEEELQDKDTLLHEKEEELQDKDSLLHEKEEELQDKDSLLYEKEEELQVKNTLLHEKEEELQAKNTLLHEKEEELQDKDSLLYEKEEDIQAKDTLLHEKEEELQDKDSLLHEKEEEIQAKDTLLHEKEENLQETSSELSHYQEHYHAAMHQRGELAQQLHQRDVELMQLRLSYEDMSNSFFWNMTKPCRKFLDFLKRNKGINLTIKGIKSLKTHGVKETLSKTRKKLSAKYRIQDYKVENTLSVSDRVEQENYKFSQNIKISIVVPLYNTPESFLVEMIDSVQQQTYGNWELCMADGSDDQHKYVGKICKELCKKDKRIQYKKLKQNLGISENTNACIEMSTGEYIGLFDHDDLLHPSALFYVMKEICNHGAEFIYTDEDKTDVSGKKFFDPHFKSDFSIDMLRSYNYICHFTVFHKKILDKVGMFDSKYNGSQDHDLILRLTEITTKIYHIPLVLYHWRVHENSTASSANSKQYTTDAGILAIESHLNRLGLDAKVTQGAVPNLYRCSYKIMGEPLISIIIPNKDHFEDLKRCIDSIQKSTYTNYEIIVVENNSQTSEIFQYYKEIEKNKKIKIVFYKGNFNYSKINNFGVEYGKGEYILLLNNDIEIISPEWLEEMLMHTQRIDVGITGAKLYYPDGSLQHGGVILGIGGVAGHSHKCYSKFETGYFTRLILVQNLSAVTAACLMVKRSVFEEVQGLDESYAVAFNDVDFCLRVREKGYLICWTPYAEAYHFESKSRGLEDTPEKQARFQGEIQRFQARWKEVLEQGDPYYNSNLTLDREDFGLR